MSTVQHLDVEYPESDGKPMGETDLHIDWTIRLRQVLKHRYRDQNVYVGSDMLLYYAEGTPSQFVVPDEFVVLDCEPHRRRVFQTWVEKRVPNVVIEITSRSTRREDETFKPRYYQEMGVQELFLYDPSGDYLRPPLQGKRLVDGVYQPITEKPTGLECQQLGLWFRLDGEDLQLVDTQTGAIQLTGEEAAERARSAEETARIAEQSARSVAEARVRELEEELRRRSS